MVDNAQFTVTQDDVVEELYVEIIDGKSATTNVFGWVLTLESCSAHHKICTVMIEKPEL